MSTHVVVRCAGAPAISAAAPGPGGPAAAEDSHGQARLVLQLAQWMSAVGQGSKEELTQLFEDAVRLDEVSGGRLARVFIVRVLFVWGSAGRQLYCPFVRAQQHRRQQ